MSDFNFKCFDLPEGTTTYVQTVIPPLRSLHDLRGAWHYSSVDCYHNVYRQFGCGIQRTSMIQNTGVVGRSVDGLGQWLLLLQDQRSESLAFGECFAPKCLAVPTGDYTFLENTFF